MEREHDMKPLLTYNSVEVCLNGRAVIHDVSFTLHAGEILGIVGESGSGKSTLLKAAMGLLGDFGVVTKGDIWFGDKNLPDLPEREMRNICGAQIGMVFQDAGASLCPIHTIGDQIYESMAAHMQVTKAQAKEKALELFEKLRLKDGQRIWESYPFELSGGMNQRVGIAIAMLMQPPVLFADEPTSALDVAVQKQVVEEMLRLRGLFGTAIILVTHDIGVVSAMADTILVLKEGNIMEYGSVQQILQKPQNSYTRNLLAAVPRLQRA
ncbi:peptide ABC transporter ATP-binding protein [Butyricicoccus pullicaecorum]|uniref:Peptide ABC transporter ATP-binding protein n=2 Tax=Butyricicoccus pullicaecorum TaxID=501571 RepID=A0A1Y4LSV0_9FIRM|nr:peptide ABC transporter ATP-binding protein [Butyricicoccus pullicaecorum]